eukprot:Gb_41188 [translate_table: standard]
MVQQIRPPHVPVELQKCSVWTFMAKEMTMEYSGWALAENNARWDDEIAWHRVDELQPTTNEASSRGPNGMKCFMVGPFLRILVCTPARTSVWKVKTSSGPSAPATGTASMTDSASVLNVSVTKSVQSTTGVSNDDFPGKSFRNFRFDSAFILRLLDGMVSSG